MLQFERSFQSFLRILDNGVTQPADKVWSLQSLTTGGKPAGTGAGYRRAEKGEAPLNEDSAARATRNWTY
jgi:hypothetical protein